MWPQENSTTGGKWEWGSWRVPAQHWPLLVGMFCGGALVLLLIVTAILWRCCVAPHRNKDYRVKMGDIESIQQRTVVPVLPSHSAVFLDPKCSQWSYNSRLVTSECGHWFYNKHVLSAATLERCTVPRSVSVPAHQEHADGVRPPRPRSQPVSLPAMPNTRVIFPDSGPCSLPLPQISEFSPGTQYASSSILDECGSRRDIFAPSIGGTILKTQSLPACVRSKTRPLSTADDPAELYAKVNFSKKRKNRMRNDEAAIIALSKSQSQFLHRDTDCLVDNEAVIVYDERTAL